MKSMKQNSTGLFVRLTRTTAPLVLATLILLGAPDSGAQSDEDLTKLKETLKQEILQELRESIGGETLRSAELEALKEELKREILQELLDEIRNGNALSTLGTPDDDSAALRRRNSPPDSDARRDTSTPPEQVFRREETGIAKGQMLREGIGLPKCKVKLVLLKTKSRAGRYQRGREYETMTDEKGFYRIGDLIPGSYKLKWQLPDDTGWIRRLRDRPDVLVDAGKLAELKPVETARRLAGQ